MRQAKINQAVDDNRDECQPDDKEKPGADGKRRKKNFGNVFSKPYALTDPTARRNPCTESYI